MTKVFAQTGSIIYFGRHFFDNVDDDWSFGELCVCSK